MNLMVVVFSTCDDYDKDIEQYQNIGLRHATFGFLNLSAFKSGVPENSTTKISSILVCCDNQEKENI
jgi:hypothetical protein